MNARWWGLLLPALLGWAPSSPGEARFYGQNLLPPPNGMYTTPGQCLGAFPGGVVISNWAMRRCSASIPPPPTNGTPVAVAFTAMVEMNLSFDGGLTWTEATVPAAVRMLWQYTGRVGTVDTYLTELLQMDLAGGGLPPTVQFRENPTLPSVGQTRIETIAGGWMIESFFDVFMECSTDGGLAWQPSGTQCRAPLSVDPDSVAPVVAPTLEFPSRAKQWASTAAPWQTYAPGIVIRGLSGRLFAAGILPPPWGVTNVITVPMTADLQLSMDGGSTFGPARTTGMADVRVWNIRDFGGQSTFDLEMIQFNLFGGDLPFWVMIRESPVLASRGGMSLAARPDGYVISSFFDVFTELSTDGGLAWFPAVNGPGRLELQTIGPAHGYPTSDHPPYEGRYRATSPYFSAYAPGIVVSNFALRTFTQSFPLPAAGVTQTVVFGATADLRVSSDGGATFEPVSGPVSVTVRLMQGAGGDAMTRFYDTEMLALNVAGGDLPPGVLARESPTRASTGRMSVRGQPDGDYRIESFFDVFTELSTDGGGSWAASQLGPGTLVLEPGEAPLSQTDRFAWCISDVFLDVPGHRPELVWLCGTGQVESVIGFNGAATDTDGDGLEQIATRLTHLGMRGTCSVGAVYATLRLGTNAPGGVEEDANNTPGILDVRPYGPAGTVESFFDVYFDVTVGGQPLHMSRPTLTTARLSQWPPDWEEVYTNLEDFVDLLTVNDVPSGLRMRMDRWVPRPRRPVAGLSWQTDGRLLVAWTNRACCFVVDRTTALSPPANDWTFFGQPAPTGTIGDIGVRFDPTNGFFRLRFVP